MEKKEFYYGSADGQTGIHAVAWIPEGKPVCLLQIVHGMAEYADRYDRLAVFLAGNGILVAGNDHLGHGKSVGTDHPYGFFTGRNAPDVVVEDVHGLRRRLQKKYPDLPFLIMGHSMGSFILRNYLCVHGEGLDGAIIMGTGMQPEGVLRFSRRLVKVLTVLQGEKHKSGLINALAFGSYNRRIRHPATPMDWLSRDREEVAKYNADPLCGFTFTLNGFGTLFALIARLYEPRRLERMPKELPVMFMAGREDPVGDYGRAVERVYTSFRQMGMRNVSLKLYENDRHELVNEADRKLIWKDIREWVLRTAQRAEKRKAPVPGTTVSEGTDEEKNDREQK